MPDWLRMWLKEEARVWGLFISAILAWFALQHI